MGDELEMPEYPENLFAETLQRKWKAMLEWHRTRDRVVMQDFEDGRIKLMKPNTIGVSASRWIEETKTGRQMVRKPKYRRVEGDEADRLWRAEVYCQYYTYEGSWAQQEYEDQKRRTQGAVLPDSDPLAYSSIDEDKNAKALREAIESREANKIKAMKYGMKRQERKNQTGRLVMGLAKDVQDYLYAVSLVHRAVRDAEEEAIRSSEATRAATGMATAMANAGIGVAEPQAMNAKPAPETKTESKPKTAPKSKARKDTANVK